MPRSPSVLAALEPRPFWEHFEALTRIARPSRREDAAIEYVRAWAARHGLVTHQDAARNLVIDVPATPGRERAPVLVLQAHLDMVCERLPDSPNDPAEGRISLVLDGDWVKTEGTTLGADNGAGIAAMMALVDDDAAPHGPLQLLMTVAEEVGLEGANCLDGSLVHGSILANLDSGEVDRLTAGCAGSTDTWLRVTRPREPVADGTTTLAVSVSGGLGGHSGGDIHLGRANAVEVLGRVLRQAWEAQSFRLVSLGGGKSRNAIPRDAAGVCAVAAAREPALRRALELAAASTRDAYQASDPGLRITVAPARPPPDAWSEAATATMLHAVALVPVGPLALSPHFDGVVETSTSIGEAFTEGETLVVHSLSRSLEDARVAELVSAIQEIGRLVGGEVEVQQNYGAWQPNLDSAALTILRRLYVQLFGDEPIVTAVHGGIEPAVVGRKVPGLDMVSFGPQIEGPHSPDERLSVASVGRFWRLLTAFAAELSRGEAT